MAATTIFTGSTAQGTTSTFSVGPASRVSISLKGLNAERGEATNRAEFLLTYDDGSVVYFEQAPVVMHADNNAVELLHAGTYKIHIHKPQRRNRNPDIRVSPCDAYRQYCRRLQSAPT